MGVIFDLCVYINFKKGKKYIETNLEKSDIKLTIIFIKINNHLIFEQRNIEKEAQKSKNSKEKLKNLKIII